jgi:hypothetical protein
MRLNPCGLGFRDQLLDLIEGLFVVFRHGNGLAA